MKTKKPKLSLALRPGRKSTHGGYSFLATGKLPEHRRYVLRYLTAAREQLIKDIGGSEENLSAQQIILIDRVISKVGILRCIEEHIRETSVMKDGDLVSPLRASYLAYSNSLRLDLQALGIDKKILDEPTDIQAYIKAFDARKRRAETRAQRKAAKAEAVISSNLDEKRSDESAQDKRSPGDKGQGPEEEA